MSYFPLTREEAEAKRYGAWAGRPNGYPYDPARCAYPIIRYYVGTQCSRRPHTGPDGLYCKQHAKDRAIALAERAASGDEHE